MSKLAIFVGMTLFGWAGWWIGIQIGLATAYILSGIGSILGVYIGWRIARDYFG